MALSNIISIACLLGALALLICLCVIDLKHRLLPNKLVFPFFLLGIVFHFSIGFEYISWHDMALGGLIGAGSLYAIRLVANWHYKTDTLGLGDVKLMGAAGVWLGPYSIPLALAIGAVAGLIHGLSYAAAIFVKEKSWPNFTKLSIPAGPGFAVGIVIAAILMILEAPEVLF